MKRIREEVDERAKQVVQAAVEFAEQSPMPDAAEVFDDLYAPPLSASNVSTNGRK